MRRLLVLAVVAACGSRPHWRAPQPQDDVDVAVPDVPAERGPGPLSVRERIPDVPWPVQQRLLDANNHRYLSKRILHDDTAVFEHMLDAFFHKSDPEIATLEQLAPYSREATLIAFQQIGARYGLCSMTPDQLGPCDRDPRAPLPRAAFEVTAPAPGVVELAIHDLSSNTPIDLGALAAARGIVLDLRDAIGSDPRPLLPWLERMTGHVPLHPLRAIERPALADRYTAAYAARFVPVGRDRAVWDALVGYSSLSRWTVGKPIAVVVGRHCESACELIARVLAAYAGATIIGGVATGGRLGRDEPALLELPHSKIDIFFYATHYLLDDAIEAATGPTDHWNLVDTTDESTEYAVADVVARLAGGPPRCDSYPAYATVAALPADVAAKLPSAGVLAMPCAVGTRITVETKAPLSVIQREARTCANLDVAAWILPHFDEVTAPRGIAALAPLSQLAQSPLVDAIRVECVNTEQPTSDGT